MFRNLSISMAYLLENREARLSMGMAAAQRARENYDVSTMVQAYEELYEDVVNLFACPEHRKRAPEIPHSALGGVTSTNR